MSRAPSGRVAVLACTTALAGVALLTVARGSEASRRREEPRGLGDEILRQALDVGSQATEVRRALLELRQRVGRHPLEARARASYAALLLALARRTDETEAAVFHARRAVALAPVTVPVVRLSTLVLAQAGRKDEALRLVRDMFGYDPERAARLLSRIEPSVDPRAVERGIPETSSAWLAWSRQLGLAGREDEAARRLHQALGRWPEDLAVREATGAVAVAHRDRERLRELFAPLPSSPSGAEAAPIFVQLAWHHALESQPDAATRALDRALELGAGDRWIRLLAGDVFEELGAIERCRSLWSGVLHESSPIDEAYLRSEALRRLGRMEDRGGVPSAALRAWRGLAALAADDLEARKRIEALDPSSTGPP